MASIENIMRRICRDLWLGQKKEKKKLRHSDFNRGFEVSGKAKTLKDVEGSQVQALMSSPLLYQMELAIHFERANRRVPYKELGDQV